MRTLNKLSTTKEKGVLYIIIIGSLFFLAPFFYSFVDTDRNITPDSFVRTFQAYEKSLLRSNKAVLTPSSQKNTPRQKLNRNLQSLLTENIEDTERISVSEESLLYVEEIYDQIVDAKKQVEILENSLRKLDSSLVSIHKNSSAKDIADGIIRHADIHYTKTSQIIDLLFSMNSDSLEIMERIIKEDGKLTQDHIIYLNDTIPEAEQNFDTLSLLYRDITKETGHLNSMFTQLTLELEYY